MGGRDPGRILRGFLGCLGAILGEFWAALETSRGALGFGGDSPGGLGLALRDLGGSLQEGSGL